jgi:hypothetical protein
MFMLTSGAGLGYQLKLFANARLDPPESGSVQDQALLEALSGEMNNLDMVRKLRAQGHSAQTDTLLARSGEGNGGWIELNIRTNLAEATDDIDAVTRPLTQHTLAGVSGLGVQKAFWNSQTRELVAAIWIGSCLSGWPGVAHGGVIVTIFEDAMARMIAGPNISLGMYNTLLKAHQMLMLFLDSVPTPTSMSVTYARPTTSFDMYIVRASFSEPSLPQIEPTPEPVPAKSWLPSWKDFTKQSTSAQPGPPVEISGTLESLDGEVKVRAKGIWPAAAIVQAHS